MHPRRYSKINTHIDRHRVRHEEILRERPFWIIFSSLVLTVSYHWETPMIRSLVIFVALALLPSAALAQGCGPMRLKVTESATLDMPPAEAWRLIGDFQDMSWAKNTVSSIGGGGNVPDEATRKVTLANGTVLEESLYRYDAAAMSYAYHIDKADLNDLPVQNTSVTLEIVPGDAGKSVVRWRAAFYRLLKKDEPAPDVADAQAAKAVSAFGQQLLEGLKAKAGART